MTLKHLWNLRNLWIKSMVDLARGSELSASWKRDLYAQSIRISRNYLILGMQCAEAKVQQDTRAVSRLSVFNCLSTARYNRCELTLNDESSAVLKTDSRYRSRVISIGTSDIG